MAFDNPAEHYVPVSVSIILGNAKPIWWYVYLVGTFVKVFLQNVGKCRKEALKLKRYHCVIFSDNVLLLRHE